MTVTHEMTDAQRGFLVAVNAIYGGNGFRPAHISNTQIAELMRKTGLAHPQWLTRRGSGYAMSNTTFMLPETLWDAAGITVDNGSVDRLTSEELDHITDAELETTSMVPARDPLYVPDGCYFDMVTLFKSGQWLPHWIHGPTGGGKTRAIEQACAATNREFFRVQVTAESDEQSLLGGFQLIDGETRYVLGRAPTAMERGGVLLLDEADLAKEKAMCLQPILEGRAIYLSRANRMVRPAKNFQAVATGNTQGRGDDTGQYIGANILNAAFIDRLGAMGIYHGYPEDATERVILHRLMMHKGIMDEQFIFQLVAWAGKCRENVQHGVIQNVISTRKLCDIVTGLAVYGDREKVMQKSLGMFDAVTTATMMSYYRMFDGITASPIPQNVPTGNTW